MRILILDSNGLFGVGIKHFLLASFPEYQVAHADCCAEARGLLEAEPHDLLLLDIGIENDNGIRLLKRFRSDHSKLPLLVLSDYPADYHGPSMPVPAASSANAAIPKISCGPSAACSPAGTTSAPS